MKRPAAYTPMLSSIADWLSRMRGSGSTTAAAGAMREAGGVLLCGDYRHAQGAKKAHGVDARPATERPHGYYLSGVPIIVDNHAILMACDEVDRKNDEWRRWGNHMEKALAEATQQVKDLSASVRRWKDTWSLASSILEAACDVVGVAHPSKLVETLEVMRNEALSGEEWRRLAETQLRHAEMNERAANDTAAIAKDERDAYKAELAEAKRRLKAVRDAYDAAGNRWDEWGERACAVGDMLDAALNGQYV